MALSTEHLCCHPVSETYRWKDGEGWEGERMCCPLTAYGRRTDEGSIGFTLSFVQMQCNCKCSSLFTSFPSHQVSIFTHMHSVHFSAFSMHYALCTSRPWRHTNTGYNAVAGGVWRRQPPSAHDSALAPDKIGRKGGKVEILWVHTYPTTSSRPRGRRVQSLVQIGSEMWICISSIKTNKQTNKHSSLYIR